MDTDIRFAIRIDGIWRPFMLFLGATPSNAFVEVSGDDVRLRFGPTFNHTISRANIVHAERTSWSLLNGLGVRSGGQIVGLIGSTGGVVELRTRQPVQLRFAGWPWVVSRIAISFEEPDAAVAYFNGASATRTPS